MCLALPAQERCAIWPVPERLNWAQCGFGHEKRVYISGAGVVRIIAVLLWQGMDQKIQSRHQLCHVTILQDYQNPVWSKNSCGFTGVVFQEPPKPFMTLNGTCTF